MTQPIVATEKAIAEQRWPGAGPIPGLKCEAVPFENGGVRIEPHVVPADMVLLWLEDGPPRYLRVGRRTWQDRPRKGLLDFFPAGQVDTLRVMKGRIRALRIYIPGRRGRSSGGDHLRSYTGPDLQFADARLHRIASHVHELIAGRQRCEPVFRAFLREALTARLEERHKPQRTANHDQQGKLIPGSLRVVVDYIDHALGCRISIETMAELIGCRPGQFVHAFRDTFGIPPHRFLLQRRVARACELIRSSEQPIGDIGMNLGFASQAHFSSAFRNCMGCTPSEYKRSIRQSTVDRTDVAALS